MRGRPPKPTYLKLLNGNPGHRPINHDEPEPDGDLIEPPAILSAPEQAIWRECIGNAPPGLLRKLDTYVLEQFVRALKIYRDAAAKVNESGAVVAIKGGQWAHNPFLSVMNRQLANMTKLTAELGFSPASRTRVKITGKKKAKSALGKLRELKLD
jgi:P27 family predicted phage terminase small subunit